MNTNLIHTLLEFVLPRKCAGCEAPKEIFCGLCRQTSYAPGAQCLICGFRNKTGKICYAHPLIEVGLQSVLWAGRYDGELKEAIWQLKYKKRKELARPLAEMMFKKFCEIDQQNTSPFAIIPIPLHFKKQHERGFNQAELLAREFAILSNTKCLTNVLVKKRETKAQVEVENKELRIRNLENAFEVDAKKLSTTQLFNYSTILLIDDVSTTGATLVCAASALKKAGAKKIVGLVVAHG